MEIDFLVKIHIHIICTEGRLAQFIKALHLCMFGSVISLLNGRRKIKKLLEITLVGNFLLKVAWKLLLAEDAEQEEIT